MSDDVVITAIVCITVVSIIGIFAILAYLKEKATLTYKSNLNNINELSITTDDSPKKSQKK